MRDVVVLSALVSMFAFAAGNEVVAPQAVTNTQSTVVGVTEAITIPQMLSYQGKLTDTLGVPVPNGNYSVVFKLYTVPSGGSPFWNETQNVNAREGLFAVLLGAVTPIGSVPDAGAAYLGMTVAGGAELVPRLRIASAAYAYLTERAADADRLQGKDTTSFVRTGQTNSVTGAMLVDGTVLTADVGDTAVTMAKIARAGASTGQVVKWTGSAWAPGQDNTGGGSGVTNVYQDTGIVCVPNPITASGNVKLDLSYGDGRYVNEAQANSVTGAMIVDGQVSSADVRDTTITTAELKDDAVTSAKILDAGVTSADLRDTTVTSAKLAHGSVTAIKLDQMGASAGQVLKWTGTWWQPANDSTGAGDNAWVRGTPDSVLYTVRKLGIARGGSDNMLHGTQRTTHVNLGVACTTGTSGQNFDYITVAGGYHNKATQTGSTIGGGWENVVSNQYSVVCGGANNTVSGDAATVGGGSQNTASGGGSVVVGGSGCRATNTRAVAGGMDCVASGEYAAVALGRADTAAGQSSFAANYNSNADHFYSAAFNGQTTTADNQTRVGALSKASGTFTIDHPLDPSGTILNHYFIEGPEMLNIYRGSVVLNAAGRAEVRLPDYFDALNQNPQVVLTGIGSSDVYLVEEVSGNRFAVGGRPGTKVNWIATGERKDISAEATRRMMPVEQPKTGGLAGRMLDDEFLSGCMDQLVREGKAQGIDFRTAAGRQRYEDMKRMQAEHEK
ncbi:hypothetical protein FJY68_08450 [candidate division WOR-3 bacterium]|uniref:Peptidase S74 domain-containing protein n=1 Tax=candidate division WOR-3 bacterium TaxID=2052148 RepID=A0A937XG97_UNCW3|nr:hypothetical protein [candidate division WOR-3 bacterium]